MLNNVSASKLSPRELYCGIPHCTPYVASVRSTTDTPTTRRPPAAAVPHIMVPGTMHKPTPASTMQPPAAEDELMARPASIAGLNQNAVPFYIRTSIDVDEHHLVH